MKLSHTTLFVRDVKAAVGFYERAFGLARHFVHESGKFAEMGSEGVTLHFADHEAVRAGLPSGLRLSDAAEAAPPFFLCFETADVAAAFDTAVAAGAPVVQTPTIKPWGQTVAVLRDIDGVLVELSNPSW